MTEVGRSSSAVSCLLMEPSCQATPRRRQALAASSRKPGQLEETQPARGSDALCTLSYTSDDIRVNFASQPAARSTSPLGVLCSYSEWCSCREEHLFALLSASLTRPG